MATRRNRIKAVINVPKGRTGPSTTPTPDRPLTPPLSSNFNNDPSSSPLRPFVSPDSGHSSSFFPSSPARIDHSNDKDKSPVRGKSPSTVHLPPSSSLLRSPSPSHSRLNTNHPTLTLVKSPPSPSPFHPPIGSPPYHNQNHNFHGNHHYNHRREKSPEKRPSQAQSPFRPLGSPSTPPPARPSPAPSPSSAHLFNTNSNSADSHEVARFMANSSPAISSSAIVPYNNTLEKSPQKTPPTSHFGGAFSSFSSSGKDHANSIVGNSDLLRQRLAKPSPAMTVSKYQTLRKEFITKYNQAPPERAQLTMLHFAFWNPPKKGVPRSRASSVSSQRGQRSKSSLSDHDVNSRLSLPDVGGKGAARRVTIETIPLSSPAPSIKSQRKYSEDESGQSDAESTTSSQQVGPRVKVGPDGQLIIDEQSLVVETSASQRAKKQLSEMETISGADFTVGSSGLFRNKRQIRRGVDWNVKETVKFYRALSMCGTDFSVMATLFPGRSRAELKSKFKREDKRNPEQISLALSCQEFDPDEGITSSEDEEEIMMSGKNRKFSTEQEKRLWEEREEDRVMCSYKSTKPRKSYPNTNIKKEKKEGALKQGVPSASWKCKSKGLKRKDLLELNDIEMEEDSLDYVPPKKSENVSKIKKKKKHDEGGDETKPKKVQQKKRKLESKDGKVKIKHEKKSDEKIPPVDEDHEREKRLLKGLGNYFVFDSTDPLGLNINLSQSRAKKVVAIPEEDFIQLNERERRASTSSDLVTLTTLEESQGHQQIYISPRTFVEDFNLQSNSASVEETQNKKSCTLQKNTKKLTEQKIKVLPYRVPGPGGPVNALISPTLVDEIEIEISCQ